VKPFSYARASVLAEAQTAAVSGARILAGGTDLLTEMKRHLVSPAALVDVKRATDPGLRAIERTGEGGLRVGALVTLADLEADPRVARGPFAALAEACASAATPAIRNQATIGGNLLQAPRCWYYRAGVACVASGGPGCPARDGDARFHAIFPGAECIDAHPSDPATALALLRAQVEVCAPGGGAREIPIAALLHAPTRANPRFHALAAGEAIAAIVLPAPPAGYRSVYEKGMSREAWSFALASVAYDGQRFALGGVAAAPVVTPDLELALAGAMPLPSNAYKLALVRGLAARAIERFRASSPAG
jgi:xanthine dehydrogenase YagS FAD-binding subunit